MFPWASLLFSWHNFPLSLFCLVQFMPITFRWAILAHISIHLSVICFVFVFALFELWVTLPSNRILSFLPGRSIRSASFFVLRPAIACPGLPFRLSSKGPLLPPPPGGRLPCSGLVLQALDPHVSKLVNVATNGFLNCLLLFIFIVLT